MLKAEDEVGGVGEGRREGLEGRLRGPDVEGFFGVALLLSFGVEGFAGHLHPATVDAAGFG